MKNRTLDILTELTTNARQIDTDQLPETIELLKNANHIFLAGAGRSGIAIQAFANRLLHLGFSVSLVNEITSPHSKAGDLLIVCSGSGETSSLVSLAKKASVNQVKILLFTMNASSTIQSLADQVLILPGQIKDQKKDAGVFSQPMGSAFEQLAFLTFDSIVLELMDQLEETSDTMYARHADFE